MAQGQALSAPRTPAFSYEPNDLTIATKPGDPLYQPERNDLPVTRDDVIAIATAGVPSSLKVRRRDDGDYVVTGRQRTKAAAVANAIGAGVKYTGPLKAVKDAIAEFGGDADFCERVTKLMRNKPIRLVATSANHGDDSHVRAVMAIENAYSHAEAKDALMRSVQEDHERFGSTPEMISLARRLTLSTVKRWLKADLSKPKVIKPRSAVRKPGAKKIRAVYEFEGLTPQERDLLGWALGETSKTDLVKRRPELTVTLAGK